eukprot:1996043-Pyramimonas_sp.AAC.1
MHSKRKSSHTSAHRNVLHAPHVLQPHKSIAPGLLHPPLSLDRLLGQPDSGILHTAKSMSPAGARR